MQEKDIIDASQEGNPFENWAKLLGCPWVCDRNDR